MMVRLREANGSTRMHERPLSDLVIVNDGDVRRVFRGGWSGFTPNWSGPMEHDDFTWDLRDGGLYRLMWIYREVT